MAGTKMTKSQIISHVAEKAGVTHKVASEVLDALVDLAYKQAHNEFTIPGLGVVALSERSARKMIMRFGANAGQEIEVPAKRVLKFRFSKTAKDAILGASVKADDLAMLEGIGPKIATALNHAGIHTFKQLSQASGEKLHEILAGAKLIADPATWPHQAKLAAEGKMEELKKLTDELQGGRKV